MLTSVPADQLFDRARQRQSFTKRRSLTHLDDEAGDSARGWFLAQFTKQLRQLLFVIFIYNISGGQLRLRVHAHVERTVSHEAETARRIFELARRNTEIKKRTAYGADVQLIEHPGCVSEIRLPHDETAAEACQSLAYMLYSVRVLIQRQNVGAAFQERLGVSTTTTRPIYDEQACFRFEQFQHFPLQNWTVIYELLRRIRFLFASSRINGEPGRWRTPHYGSQVLTNHRLINQLHLPRAGTWAFPPRVPVSNV